MENNLVFKIGAFKRNADFCVYNPFNIQLSDEPLQLSEITLENNSFLEKVKSYTWSCNCKFFFVINKNNVIIGNTQNNEAFLSHNLSKEVFQEYLNAFKN